MSDFLRTPIVMKLLDGTLPRIATALERIAKALEEQNEMAKSNPQGDRSRVLSKFIRDIACLAERMGLKIMEIHDLEPHPYVIAVGETPDDDIPLFHSFTLTPKTEVGWAKSGRSGRLIDFHVPNFPGWVDARVIMTTWERDSLKYAKTRTVKWAEECCKGLRQ